jgi:CRP/FNR family cyclic AMP-dependent transcriptional regulator
MEATLKVTGLFNNAQRTVNVAAGSEVFRQGDTGEEMYGVVSGEIELRINDKAIRTLGADDVFGEMALVQHTPRSATAVATKDSVLAVINRHRFLFLVQETPMFALQVMSAMATKSGPAPSRCSLLTGASPWARLAVPVRRLCGALAA